MNDVRRAADAGHPLRLMPWSREEHIDRLASREFDVCVVGGGITGAGVALDCASRGLSVALLEMADFASGSSSKSSRMVHGGLRYLGHGDARLCRACLRERDLLRRLAPHLVRPIPFMYAHMTYGSRHSPSAVGLVLSTYDALAGPRSLGRHHRLGERAALELPLLRSERVRAAWTYWDAVTDDARLVLEVLRTAHAFGATSVNHIRVEHFGSSSGRMKAVEATDGLAGTSVTVRARTVVNAAGIWADDIARRSGADVPRLRPSKGVHLVVPSALLPLETTCVFSAPDGREVFVAPDGQVVMIGTTDTEPEGPLDDPVIQATDVSYLIEAVEGAFRVDLQPRDVVAAWAGFRPLADGSERPSGNRTRRWTITVSPSGVVTVIGGKLTLFRAMAKAAGDAICNLLGVRGRSETHRIGIGCSEPLGELIRRTSIQAGGRGIGASTVERLVASYGNLAPDVLDLAAGDERLARPLADGIDHIGAEAVWAVRHEMAMGLDDVLTRRLRLATSDRDAGIRTAVPSLVGSELGWSDADEAREVRAYAERVARERGPLPSPRGHSPLVPVGSGTS